MKPPAWPRVTINDCNGIPRQAIAPLVISVSRATDIPAHFSTWFLEQWERGYVEWKNPFNGKPLLVSFEKVRVIVFWSKNPAPLLPHLGRFRERGILTLFQVTVNDYEHEGFEPGIPPLRERIATVRSLSAVAGNDRVLWRFDPLLLTGATGPRQLLDKIERIGDQLYGAVSRLTVSFFSPYRTPVSRMRRSGIVPQELSETVVEKIGTGLSQLKHQWKMEIVTCAEKTDLRPYGIQPGSCIDPDLVFRLAGDDPLTADFFSAYSSPALFKDPEQLRRRLKDPGQRPRCNCMVSKDIGRYGTCTFGCVYCYAGQKSVRR